jgi:hypothetical protein
MSYRMIVLVIVYSLLAGCAAKERPEFTAKEKQEWLQPILKPEYIMWVNDGVDNYRFVLVEANDDGLVGEDLFIPYHRVKHISWKTPQQTESYCAKNPAECEAYWYLGSVLIWLPFLL